MNILYTEHQLVLQKMLDKKLDFILIGGYAVNYYGYNRVTGDMDVWVKPDNENKKVLLTALLELGYDEKGISIIGNWDFTKPQSFHVGNPPERTDFMTFISGVKYDTAKQNSISANIDGLKFSIIHLSNLIENKKASGRLKDLTDVEHLQKIFLLRNKK